MKKLLYQFDTDPLPAVFDNVVAYDGGADHVIPYGGVNPKNVGALVDGAIFTRAPKDKKLTAIFVGGANMAEGEELVKAVRKKFFSNFRVSVMLDSNGSNTTAAAAVAWLAHGRSLAGKKAVVLAGTGPVGQRAAVMLAREGAQVTITSRKPEQGEKARQFISARFDVHVEAVILNDPSKLSELLPGVDVLLNSGPAGVQMVPRSAWTGAKSLKVAVDLNAVPPLGIEGIEVNDAGVKRENVVVFGAFGVGNFKTKLHKACVARLFTRNDLVLDAEAIADIARELISARESDNRREPVAKKELAKKK